jgi:hydrogenase nickel incorporation protein HypB
MMKIKVLKNILDANEQIAARNRARLDEHRVIALNIMASPGAGKTSLVVRTVRELKNKLRLGVVEGDIASTIDADRVAQEGVPVVQINTGGECHIDANMVGTALDNLALGDLDLLLIENVGNLVCPAEFDTGAHRKVMLLSVPEGDDKPFKYPLMFTIADAIIINKIDTLPLFDFNVDNLEKAVRGMNPQARLFKMSLKTGEGFPEWLVWLEEQIKRR